MTQSQPVQPATGAEAPSPPRHVGELLRRRREELGYSLPGLAGSLRIRQVYLEAIEQGRWADLPGHAYITGFLRSYAAALGLEPGPVLTRFKQDSAGMEQTAELYFPEPVDESRVPSGALVLIAILLGGVAYGGWYVTSSGGRGLMEGVPELPARLAGLIFGEEEAAPAAPEPAPVLPATRVEELIGRSQPTAPEVGAATAPPTGAPPALPPDAPSAALAAATAAGQPSPAPDPAAEGEDSEVPQIPPDLATPLTLDAEGRPVPAATGEGAPEPDAPGAPPATALMGAGSAPASAADPSAASALAPSAPVAAAEGAPPGQPASPATGRVFGQTEGPVRVTVRAVEDSWIEVRDARGTLWAARNLRPGDVFRAPDVEGLTLSVVGNGAGIVLSVDGQDLPPLGGRGQVVRDVPLVPDAVRARLGR